jgi:uroporphyrinogen-III synthase
VNALRLLVTRPQPDGSRIAAALRRRGHDALLAPLMRIEPLAADLGVGAFAAIFITSANAARAIAGHARRAELTGLPLYAVGRHSAEAARAAGFTDVTSADGEAKDLVALLAVRRAQAGLAGPLLYLGGEDRAGDLAGDLAAHGLAVHTAVVYRAVALDFPLSLTQALKVGALDAALHFSRRSAALFLAGARAAGIAAPALALRHYCLSPQVAEPLRAAGAGKITVAPRPEEAALIDFLG